jgi:ribosomal protein L11 methyltransferase
MIANILAAPLREMAFDISTHMRSSRLLVLSGLLRTQARSIEACYRAQGFKIVWRIPLDEWMTLILKHKPQLGACSLAVGING